MLILFHVCKNKLFAEVVFLVPLQDNLIRKVIRVHCSLQSLLVIIGKQV